mgnify:FL=1
MQDLPVLMLSLLSDDLLFFQEGEIAWDGKRHSIRGIQANAPKLDELSAVAEEGGFDDISDLVKHFIAFIGKLEEDEGLVVPCGAIAPEISNSLPEGDLTGITLANLAAFARAIIVRNTDDGNYGVLYDSRLSMGIPCFFNLMARLIWDMRQLSLSLAGKPFTVSFVGSRNFDADVLFPTTVSSVAGRQENPLSMTVDQCPSINLPSGSSNTPASESAPSLSEKQGVDSQAKAERHAPEKRKEGKLDFERSTDTQDLPVFMLSLLSDDLLFFQKDDIAWDGKHHSIQGIHANEPKLDDLKTVVEEGEFSDISDLANHFAALLAKVEEDEGLVIPRIAIAPGISKALPEGDLTGITLANLAAYAQAITICNANDGDYAVRCDNRLTAGIPCFYNLVARLIWDMRQLSRSLAGKPFTIAFSERKSMDADMYFPRVVGHVAGKQKNPLLKRVRHCPPVWLSYEIEEELKKKKAADKLVAKDASSSKGKPSVQVEPNRALLQKLALQIAEKKTYTEEDRRKDEEAREAARQAAVEAGAERHALDRHEKVVEQFEKGRKGDKSTTFDGGPRERVCYHLLERGGGLTEQEIFDDLNRTRNVKWRQPNSNGGSVKYDKMLQLMSDPSRTIEYQRYLPMGEAAQMAKLLDEQKTIKSDNGMWFLWCQDGVDWGQRLLNASAALADAKEKSGRIEQFEKERRSFLAEKEELQKQIKQLGLFDFKARKPLKERLSVIESELSQKEGLLKDAHAKRDALPTIEGELKAIRKACQSEYRDYLIRRERYEERMG